jgi:hypothetical protein
MFGANIQAFVRKRHHIQVLMSAIIYRLHPTTVYVRASEYSSEAKEIEAKAI